MSAAQASESTLSKFRHRTWMSIDVSFQGKAVGRRENRCGQQWVGSCRTPVAPNDPFGLKTGRLQIRRHLLKRKMPRRTAGAAVELRTAWPV